MDEQRLRAALAELGAEVAFPPTPPMTDRVMERLRAPSVVRRSRRLVRVALVTAVVMVALVLAFPGPRQALADLFGLGSVRITIVPEPPPTPTLSGFFGEVVDLHSAQSAVDFDLLLPVGYTSPNVVFLDSSVPGGLVTLAFGPGPDTYGLVITEMSGSVEQPLLEKAVGPGIPVTRVDVGGDPGFWIEGAHLLFLLDETGGVQEDEARLVGNTLLFVRGGVTIRIESALGLADALEIAEVLEP